MGVIRLARAEDAEAILNIYRPHVEDSAASFETVVPSINEITGRIRNCLPEYCWLVFEEGGEIRGYAYSSKHHVRAAYRWAVDVSIYIDESWQGEGIGKALYSALFSILRLQGYYNAYACICLPNPGSVGIHEYYGFQKIAHYNKIGYKLGKWWDIGWWEIFLLDKNQAPSEPCPIDRLNQENIRKILSQAEPSYS